MPYDAERDLVPAAPAGERLPQTESGSYKIVSIRLRMAEFEAFSDQAGALGLTSNLALRIAARRIGGFLEIDAATRRHLEKIVAGIGEISRNVARLYSAYAHSGLGEARELAEQREAFGREFAELDALLRSILNISRRRSDGCRMLKESMK